MAMSSVTGGNLENNWLQRVLLLPLELSKLAKVQAATKKIDRKKKKAKYDTWSQPRIMTPPDAETSAISTKDDFESQLYLGEVFVFYV